MTISQRYANTNRCIVRIIVRTTAQQFLARIIRLCFNSLLNIQNISSSYITSSYTSPGNFILLLHRMLQKPYRKIVQNCAF